MPTLDFCLYTQLAMPELDCAAGGFTDELDACEECGGGIGLEDILGAVLPYMPPETIVVRPYPIHIAPGRQGRIPCGCVFSYNARSILERCGNHRLRTAADASG